MILLNNIQSLYFLNLIKVIVPTTVIFLWKPLTLFQTAHVDQTYLHQYTYINHKTDLLVNLPFHGTTTHYLKSISHVSDIFNYIFAK